MVGWVNRCSGRIQIQCRSGRPTVFLTTHNHKHYPWLRILRALTAQVKAEKPFGYSVSIKRGKSATGTHMRGLGELNADTSLWLFKTPLPVPVISPPALPLMKLKLGTGTTAQAGQRYNMEYREPIFD